ncbi:MAG: hypothetical protein MHPSP_001594, partial [Paramarteilia canceri]
LGGTNASQENEINFGNESAPAEYIYKDHQELNDECQNREELDSFWSKMILTSPSIRPSTVRYNLDGTKEIE